MFAIRLLVTLMIIVPYWAIRQPRDTAEIFVVALIAFASGRLAAAVFARRDPEV